MFGKLRLPIRQKTFRSGLIVIMDSSATEESIESSILAFITASGAGVTPLQVGNKFSWSVGVASELLQVRLFTSSLYLARLPIRFSFLRYLGA